MMNQEFKNAVKEIKAKNEKFDWVDCLIEKFEDYVYDKNHRERKSSDFLNTLEDIDERLLLIRLFGNYHYQVNNGGHYQYFDNGYCSTDDIDHGFFGRKSEDLDLHNTMIKLFKKYLPKTDVTVRFINNLDQFVSSIIYDDCECCGGNGTVDGEEVECSECQGRGYIEEDGEEVECYECNGSGYVEEDNCECCECNGTGLSNCLTVVNSNFLDKTYYDIEDEILKIINKMIENWLNSDDTNDCAINKIENDNNVKNNKKIILKLVGTDGNAFSVLGKVKDALRKANVSQEIIDKFFKEATQSDYDNLMCVCMKYCTEANIEVC